MLPFNDLLKSLDGVFTRNIFSASSGKCFCNEERLRQKALDFSRAVDRKLVCFRKLFHPEDCNNILKLIIALKNLLNIARNFVMLLPYYFRVERC